MKTAVMCIGNRHGGDDAVGPYIADELKKESIENLRIVDCGTVPENFTSKVKKYNPTMLVLIDATEMGLAPGEIRRIPKEKVGTMHVSTHGIPLSIMISYMEKYMENVILIGIQPKKMDGNMSEAIKKSGDKLVELIKNMKFLELETLVR
ncbi:MAG: hydrogenase maturation peptidase HycI [Euryarchaeota archaeon]|nr:hydrogenase maturation peptidase HycI [Euryarchaeota archaeon]